MIRAINKITAPIARRVALMVARGVLTRSGDDAKMQTAQVELLSGEVRELERFQNYGYTARPHDGAEVVSVFVGGNRDHGLAVAIDDRRYRVTGLQNGEVAVYDDIGHQITLARSGIQIDGANHNIAISGSPVVQVTGGDVIADGVSLKGHRHQDTQPGTGLSGIPVGGASGGGGGGSTQGDLDQAVIDAEAAAVAANEAKALAVLAKNDAVQAKTDALIAQGEALIQAGLASGFAQTASDAVTLATNQTNLAGGHASAALTSRNEASSFASDASGYATSAAQQLSLTVDQKTIASGHASAALTSRNEAAGFASDASGYATTASQQLALVTEQKSLAEGYANSALTYKNQSSSFADAASGYASLASQQVTLAADQTTLAGGHASAALTSRNEASTFADSAASSASAAAIQYNSLSTTVEGHTSSISNLAISQNGLSARWGVTLNNNGHITGIATYSDMAANGETPTSAVVVQAEKFVFVSGSTPYTDGNNPNPANVPFRIVSGITYIKSANIEQLSIGTGHAAYNAFTVAESVSPTSYPFTLAATNLGVFDHTNVASMALAVSDQASKRLILFGFQLSHAESDPGYVQIFIRKSTDTPWTSSGFTIDASSRIIEGTSDQSYLIMKDLTVAANENVSVVIDVRFANGNATHEWSVTSDAWFYHMKLFAFTGKR